MFNIDRMIVPMDNTGVQNEIKIHIFKMLMSGNITEYGVENIIVNGFDKDTGVYGKIATGEQVLRLHINPIPGKENKPMKSEYTYTLTVEVKAGTDKEEHEALKRFKRELFNKYGGMDGEVMVTGMKRE